MQEEDKFNLEYGKSKKVDSFNFPIPGHSLTDEPGKWPWDKTPDISDPDSAVEFVTERIENNKSTKENMIRLLASGVSVETLINTVALGGFQNGTFNPDVAELIKPPLAVYFIDLAIRNSVPVKVFEGTPTELDEKDVISHEDAFTIMREKNPREYNKFKRVVEMMGKKPLENNSNKLENRGFISIGSEDVQ